MAEDTPSPSSQGLPAVSSWMVKIVIHFVHHTNEVDQSSLLR